MIKWKREKERYGFADVGYLGKFKSFEIRYDGMCNRGDKKKQKLTCFLNGIKPQLGNFSDVDEAKLFAEEKIIPMWLSSTGLQFKEG